MRLKSPQLNITSSILLSGFTNSAVAVIFGLFFLVALVSYGFVYWLVAVMSTTAREYFQLLRERGWGTLLLAHGVGLFLWCLLLILVLNVFSPYN